eukprot:g5734.t1
MKSSYEEKISNLTEQCSNAEKLREEAVSNLREMKENVQEKYEGKVQEMVTIENELKEKLETLMLEKQESEKKLEFALSHKDRLEQQQQDDAQLRNAIKKLNAEKREAELRADSILDEYRAEKLKQGKKAKTLATLVGKFKAQKESLKRKSEQLEHMSQVQANETEEINVLRQTLENKESDHLNALKTYEELSRRCEFLEEELRQKEEDTDDGEDNESLVARFQLVEQELEAAQCRSSSNSSEFSEQLRLQESKTLAATNRTAQLEEEVAKETHALHEQLAIAQREMLAMSSASSGQNDVVYLQHKLETLIKRYKVMQKRAVTAEKELKLRDQEKKSVISSEDVELLKSSSKKQEEELRSKIQALRSSISALREKLQTCEAARDEFRNRSVALQKTVSELEQSREEFRNRSVVLQETLSDLEARTRSRLDNDDHDERTKKEKESQEEESNNAWHDDDIDLEDEEEDKEEEEKRLIAELNDVRIKHQEYETFHEKERANLHEKMKVLVTKYNHVSSAGQAASESVQQLTSELKHANVKERQLRERVTELENGVIGNEESSKEIQALQEKSNDLLQSVERYQSENQALRDKASESSDEIERLVEELSQARNELKAATSVSELRQELENVKRAAKDHREKYEQTVAKYKEKLTMLLAKYKALKKSQKNNNVGMEPLRVQNDTRVSDLERRLEQANEEISSRDQEILTLSERIKQIETSLKTAESSLKSAESSHESYEKELETKQNEWGKEKKRLVGKMKELIRRFQLLKKKHAELKKSME